MAEKAHSASIFDYFWKIISFNRTRIYGGGDYFLFRPGHYLTLGIIDILLRDKFLLTGILSIIFHGLTVLSLFSVLIRLVSFRWAFLWALVFLVQYAGMEMIMWRHISPYMAGIFFYNSGVLSVIDSVLFKRNKLILPVVCFFISCLFHEINVVTLFFISLIFYFLNKLNNNEKNCEYKINRLVTSCIVPIVIFLLLNNLDFLIRHTTQLLGPHDVPVDIKYLAGNIIYINGFLTLAFIVPFLFDISYLDFLNRASFSLNVPQEVIYFFGMAFLCFIVLTLVANFRKRSFINMDQIYLIQTFSGVYLFVTLLGFVLIRISFRDRAYVFVSSYYFYITSYFTILFIISSWKKYGFNIRGKHWSAILIFLIASQIFFSAIKICSALNQRKEFDQSINLGLKEFEDFFDNYPDYCYGGSLLKINPYFGSNNDLFGTIYPKAYSCIGKTPLYLSRDIKNNYQLVRRNIKFEKVVLNSHDFENQGNFKLSKFKLNPTFLQASLYKPKSSFILAYKDQDKYLQFFLQDDYIQFQSVIKGKPSHHSFQAAIRSDKNSVKIEIIRINDRCIFFKDGIVLLQVSLKGSIEGRVGFLRGSAGEEEKVLIFEYVLEDISEIFEPVINLNYLKSLYVSDLKEEPLGL